MSGPLVTAEDRAALDRPIARALGLPARAYGEAAFALERERLFARCWTPIGVGARIPSPGDAMPVDLAGWPLVMVRDRSGGVKVFLNVCPHRGMRLVDQPCRIRTVIRCPWHSWSFDLSGALVATPSLGGHEVGEADGFDRPELGLREVRAGQWLDYVFVDLSGKAPPLEDHVRPLDDLLAGRDLSRLRHGGSWDHAYPGNWKLSVEGGIEDYHLPWGHPQLLEGVIDRTPSIHTADGCFSAVSAVAERTHAPAAQPELPLPPIPLENGVDPRRNYIINVFPVGILTVEPDHIMMGLFTPDGPERTRIAFDFYFLPEAMTDDLADAREQRMRMWREVAPQDERFVAGVQSTLLVRDLMRMPTRFSPVWEGAVRHFQQNVADQISLEAL